MILRERYKKEMEHIVVTEQLKNKVIAQIEEAKAISSCVCCHCCGKCIIGN